MIVTRIQLHCANEKCDAFFPENGALDGAIYTPFDLRQAARREKNWARRVNGDGFLVDVCPKCDADGYPQHEVKP